MLEQKWVFMRHLQISGFPDPYHRWSPAVMPHHSCCSWWEPAFPESNKSAPQSPGRCPTRENSLLCHWPKHKHTLYSNPTGALHSKVLLFYLNSQVIEDFGRPGIQRCHQVASASWEEDSGNDTEVVTAQTPMAHSNCSGLTGSCWVTSHQILLVGLDSPDRLSRKLNNFRVLNHFHLATEEFLDQVCSFP